MEGFRPCGFAQCLDFSRSRIKTCASNLGCQRSVKQAGEAWGSCYTAVSRVARHFLALDFWRRSIGGSGLVFGCAGVGLVLGSLAFTARASVEISADSHRAADAGSRSWLTANPA